MNYSDTSLKQVLAKMLPDILYLQKDTFILCKGTHIAGTIRSHEGYVLDTELLHFCWLVEETLTEQQAKDYSRALGNLVVKADKDEYWKEGIGSIQTHSIHAIWQQRVIALAKVKGIEDAMLDAIKEGMIRAVYLNQENLGKDNYDLCKAIPTGRDNLKEL